ncbi:hypothetical protein ACFLR8_02975 [Bacteroidota bacterium]
MEEPTLEILAVDYDMIMFKHCFPISNIQEDDTISDVNYEKKTLGNYKLQYIALKEKLYEFPQTKFIIWTGAALVEKSTSPEEAGRAREFASWVSNVWDEPNDNVYIFDFRQIETNGDLYMKSNYSVSVWDSHPNPEFSQKAAQLLVNRLIDIIMNDGVKTTLAGEYIL